MKTNFKIAISDFWTADTQNDYLFRLLAQRYNIMEIDDKPDILFFSCFGDNHFKYDCLKVFYTGENVVPDFRVCDYAFSYEDTDDRNFQMPNFVRHPFFHEFRTQNYSSKALALRKHPKSRFSNFLYSNDRANERVAFCKKLMLYKKVDCAGKVLNNFPSIDADWMAKFDFIKRYKFTIAFENTSNINYTTEKLYHPLLVGSIPIYWGNPKVSEFFNPSSFINCHDYDNFDQVIERIIEVDNNDALYRKYLTASPLFEKSKIYAITEEAILGRLDKIVGNIGAPTLVGKTNTYKYHKYRFNADGLLSSMRGRIRLFVNYLKRLTNTNR